MATHPLHLTPRLMAVSFSHCAFFSLPLTGFHLKLVKATLAEIVSAYVWAFRFHSSRLVQGVGGKAGTSAAVTTQLTALVLFEKTHMCIYAVTFDCLEKVEPLI